MPKTAIVLLNLGGPDSLDAVRPFLENLFNDPDIFKLPFQRSLAKIISKSRAPKVIEEYKLIGNKSPIGYWTELQRKMLENNLKKIDNAIDVYIAMRYWHPLTKETADKISDGNYEKIILVPLYPHFSVSTTGSSFNEWNRVFKKNNEEVIFINDYYEHPKYLKAINERIDEAYLKFPTEVRKDIQLVFSAHGTPVSYVEKGDPYSEQIKKSMNEIMKLRNFSNEYHLCFQSKVGPMKWLEPSTSDTIKELISNGKRNLLIIPISFVSDHIETLFELGIFYRKMAEESGVENYIVMQGLNDSELFIDALFDIVKTHLSYLDD